MTSERAVYRSVAKNDAAILSGSMMSTGTHRRNRRRHAVSRILKTVNRTEFSIKAFSNPLFALNVLRSIFSANRSVLSRTCLCCSTLTD